MQDRSCKRVGDGIVLLLMTLQYVSVLCTREILVCLGGIGSDAAAAVALPVFRS